MAGMEKDTPLPTEIRLHQTSRQLELIYGDVAYRLDFEYLRVYTPSAEARGHAPGQEILQVGKRNVDLLSIEPVGNYALRLSFSDGHDTGLYTWDLLHNLAVHAEALWAAYLEQLANKGLSRDVDPTHRPNGPSCGQRH